MAIKSQITRSRSRAREHMERHAGSQAPVLCPPLSYIYAVSAQVQCPRPATLRRRRYSQGFSVLSNGTAGDLDALGAEDLGDPVIGEDGCRRLGGDQRLHAAL